MTASPPPVSTRRASPPAAATEEERVLEFVNSRLARTGPVRDLQLNLVEAQIIDSMAMLELVVWMEQTFGVRVRNDDLIGENFRSVAALAGYIRRARTS